MKLVQSSGSHDCSRLTMATPCHVYAITRVAKMLGVDVELLHGLAMTMEPEAGVIVLSFSIS
jgi:hypothetical protein